MITSRAQSDGSMLAVMRDEDEDEDGWQWTMPQAMHNTRTLAVEYGMHKTATRRRNENDATPNGRCHGRCVPLAAPEGSLVAP